MLGIGPRNACLHICYAARKEAGIAKSSPKHADDLHVPQVHVLSHNLVSIQPDSIHHYAVFIVFVSKVQDAGLAT